MSDNVDMSIVIQAQNDTETGFEDLISALENLQTSIEEMTSAFTDSADTIATSMSDAADSISASMTDATTEISDNLKEVTDNAEAAAKAVDSIGSGSGGSGGAGGSEEETTTASRGNSSSGAMGSMGVMMAGMEVNRAVDPIIKVMAGAVTSFATFDQSMRMVNEEAKLSESGFKGMEQSVLSLSSATGLSANDLAQGYYNIMATGLTNAAGGMEVLTAAAKGAKAGNASLSDTTKALDSVMGAYGMKASSVGSVLDIMFAATNDGQMHFADLAKSVGASATAAALAGVSYQELAASQATLTNVGKNAQVASQQLNSLIMGIIAPTAGATKEAKALGIEWDAGALKAHGLAFMINEATKASGGNDETLKKLVPNVRAFTAVVALGTTAHGLYNKTLKDMQDASGATQAALNQASKGIGDSINDVKNALTNAGMAMTLNFSPAIIGATNLLSGLLTWFVNLSPNVLNFIAVFAGITVVAGKIAAGILACIATTQILAFVFKTSATGILMWGAGIMVVVGVLAAFAMAYTKNFGGFQTFMNGVFKSVGLDIAAFQDDMTKGLSPLTGVVDILERVFGPQLGTQIGTVLADIGTDFGTFKNNIAIVLGDFKQAVIKSFGKTPIQDFGNTVAAAMPLVQKVISSTFGIVTNLVKNVFIPGFKLGVDVVKSLGPAFGVVAGEYVTIFAPALNAIIKLFGAVVTFIAGHQKLVDLAMIVGTQYLVASKLAYIALGIQALLAGTLITIAGKDVTASSILVAAGTKIVWLATAAWEAMDFAAAALDIPLALVVLAVAAVIAVLVLLGYGIYQIITHWSELSKAGAKAWKSIMDTVQNAAASIGIGHKAVDTASDTTGTKTVTLDKTIATATGHIQTNTGNACANSINSLSSLGAKCAPTGTNFSQLNTTSSAAVSTMNSNINKTVGSSILNLGRLGASGATTSKALNDGLNAGMASSSPVAQAEDLVSRIKNAFTKTTGLDIHSPSKWGTWVGGNLGQGIINGMSGKNITSFMSNLVQKVKAGAGGVFSAVTNMGGNVSSWLTSALAATGTPASWMNGMLTMINAESGGSPTAQNASGATGIAQMMPETFSSHMASGHNNILNPIDNLMSSINYIKSEYGSVYGIKNLGTSAYKGYKDGIASATAGLHLVGEMGPELIDFGGGGQRVINNQATMAMASKPYTSNGSNTPPITINIQCSGNITKSETELANIIQGKIWDKLKSSGKF